MPAVSIKKPTPKIAFLKEAVLLVQTDEGEVEVVVKFKNPPRIYEVD